MVSSTESLVKAATVATTSNQPEAVLVNKAGSSGARVAGYDEEEIRLRAQMKAAALEQDSDDDEETLEVRTCVEIKFRPS